MVLQREHTLFMDRIGAGAFGRSVTQGLLLVHIPGG